MVEVEVEVVAALEAVEVEAVEATVEIAAATVVEAMVVAVVVETVVVEEAPRSITSTLPSHKSTTPLLTRTRIKPTLSHRLQLLPLLWQPLLL